MRLSVLDQSTVASGRTPSDSIQETLRLAQHCEHLGYARYWLAEHHNSASQAGTAPEVLIAAIAAATKRIRVGSAGVMLPHYSALKVAEQFRILEAIAPGRIDMGMGRAPGSDRRTAYALNPAADTAADQFPSQVRDALDWVRGNPLAQAHPFAGVSAQPEGATAPEAWILGSSDYGAQVAAHFGLPYCFAHFITDGHGAAQALDLYRSRFRPSSQLAKPFATVAVWAMAADTEREADAHFSSRGLWWLKRNRGVFEALPSVEQAAAYPYASAERALLADYRQQAFAGAAASVVARLQSLAKTLDITEIVVLTTIHDAEVRRRSYELLAEAAHVTPAHAAVAA